MCVTKEGLSAPDRSSEKSANAFLMSGAERRREERVPFESRAKKNKQKNANPHAPRRTRSLRVVVVAPRANRRQLELILRNQQKSAAEADQGFGGI